MFIQLTRDTKALFVKLFIYSNIDSKPQICSMLVSTKCNDCTEKAHSGGKYECINLRFKNVVLRRLENEINHWETPAEIESFKLFQQ